MNSMMLNKTFCKSMDDGFARSTVDEGKSISREVSIPVKIKHHDGKVIITPAGVWQDYQGNGVISVSQILSLGRLDIQQWPGPDPTLCC